MGIPALRSRILTLMRVAWLVPGMSLQVWGQVATDGSLGRAISLTGPSYAVTADLGRQLGRNLYHSFSQFSLTKGESATFSGPASVGNIISRVTGGSVSSIDGRIASTIAGANFYFLNPAGIVFGPNASLDLSGSASFSTGNHLNFADGSFFSASHPEKSSLTVADPTDFGFLGGNAAIELRSASLSAASGKSLHFSAGSIAFQDSHLAVQGGSIELLASDAGSVSLTGTSVNAKSESALSPGKIFISGGRIALESSVVSSENAASTAAAPISLNAADMLDMRDSRIETSTTGLGGGADILCLATDIWLDGSRIKTMGSGAGASGNVSLTATGEILAYGMTDTGYSYIGSNTSGEGSAGNVSIDASRLELWDGAQVNSTSFASSSGSGGSIFVNVGGPVIASGINLEGYPSGFVSESYGSGAAGGVMLYAGDLLLQDGGVISTSTFDKWQGAGNAGNIFVSASSSLQVKGASANGRSSGILSNTSGSGSAGYVSISAPDISIIDGGQVGSSAFGTWWNAGSGGFVSLQADRLEIDGTGSNGYPAGIFATTYGPGIAGNIDITAGNVRLGGGARINTTSYGTMEDAGSGGMIYLQATGQLAIDGMSTDGSNWRTGILANTEGPGSAGSIWIQAGSVTLSGGGLINSSTYGVMDSAGDGGMVTIFADAVKVAGNAAYGENPPSGIFTESSGPGAAGYISLDLRELEISAGGTIGSSSYGKGAISGSGGYIDITAADSVKLIGVGANGQSSRLLAETYGTADGGYINIQAGKLEVTDGGQILAITRSTADDAGAGGYVAIDVLGRASLSGIGSNGEISGIYASTTGAGNAGFITMTAGELAVLDGAVINTTSFSKQDNAGAGGYIQIEVTGDTLIKGNGSSGGSVYSSGLLADTFGPGAGGYIFLSSGSLHILDGGTISSGTYGTMTGAGAGGYIDIVVSGDTVISGTQGNLISSISTESFGPGAAGSISLSGRNILVADGGQISSTAYADTDHAGAWGSVTVSASETLRLAGTSLDGGFSGIFTNTEGNAYAGDIYLDSKRLEVVDGAIISSSSLGERPDARGEGIIQITSDSVLISGAGSDGFPSGVYSETYGPGTAGSITIDARVIEMKQGGRVSSTAHSTTAPAGDGGSVEIYATEGLSMWDRTSAGESSGIFVETLGPGNAGGVYINAGQLSMGGGAQISSATRGTDASAGGGGSVFIEAGNVFLTGKAADNTPTSINAASYGAGSAGMIEIHASDTLSLAGNAQIATRADYADGGNITLRIGEMLKVSHSSITTSVGSGYGNGGNIDIDPSFVVLNDGLIQANAYGGNGGNIRIVTDHLIASTGSRIEASSELGIDGNVEVTSPNVDVGSGLAVMPSHFLDSALLLRDTCAGRADRAAASSFIGVGNGGLPQGTIGALTSRYDGLASGAKSTIPHAQLLPALSSLALINQPCGERR